MSKISIGLDPKDAASFKKLNETVSNLPDELKDGANEIAEKANKAIADAFHIGARITGNRLNASFKQAQAGFQETNDDFIKKQKELAAEEAKYEEEMSKASDEAAKERLTAEISAKRRQLAEEIGKRKNIFEHNQRKEMSAFMDRHRKDISRIEEQKKMIEAAHESAAKLWRTHFQDGGEAAGELMSSALTTNIEDISKGILGGAGKAFSFLGNKAAAKLESREAAGKGGGPINLLLSAATRLGPVVIGLTAAVAGISAVFMAAYGQVKEFNKTILDAAPAMDLFGGKVFEEGFKLGESLKEIRDAAHDFADITKVSAQEALGLITSFNNSGVALSQLRSEFSKSGSATEAYTEMAMFANTYTRALGISIDELTTHTGTMFTKLGMGMDSIAEGFSSITAGAQLAGLNVKDFFTAVSQTTSGLALYNIRLDKTAEQLLGLMKIMDRDKAKDLLESKEMGGKGIEERFKAGMLVGGGGQKIFQAAMKSQMDNFTKDFGDKFTDTFKEFDIDKLGELTGKEFGSLQQAIIAEGTRKEFSPEQTAMAVQRMEKLRKVQIGAKGGTMNMAKGMSGLSGLADVAMRITEGMSLVGAQNLDDMGYIARKSFEDLSGISGENFDQMASLINNLQGTLPTLSIPEILEQMALGNVPMTEADKKLFDELSKTKPKTMEALAQEQVNAMTSVNDTLKNVIARLLESLGNLVTDIIDGLSNWDIFKSGAAANREDRETLKGEAAATKEEKANLAEKIKKLEGEIAAEKSKPEGKQAKIWLESNQKLLDQMIAEKAALEKKIDTDEKAVKEMGNRGTTRLEAEARSLGIDTNKVVTSERTVRGETIEKKETVAKTAEELLKEVTEARALAEKKASEDAIAEREKKKLEEKNLKVAEDSKKAAEKTAALQQLTSTYGGAAVTAALGGNASALKSLIGTNKAAQGLATTGGIRLNDFIYRGDGTRGTINPINKRDEFFGAKPGGAIDKAINGGGGGVVNIYISGDEAKVYNVVKRVIQESGLRAPAGGR
jgi:hypothetical protein